ncbi:MAG TPA: hypothetical protein VFB36_06930 [Nevskiaceae bacterium]|nr:hypothetical protein [Nevskiaceae bacterium]
MRVLAAGLSAAGLLAGFAFLPEPVVQVVTVPYDRDAAILLAGKQVPDEIDSFYFFVLDTETSVDEDGEELALVLQKAAIEQDYLGIVGPDPERNRATLLHALDASRGSDLSGVIVIYVGPDEQADELARRIGETGAELRFVTYPQQAVPGAPSI